MTVTRGPDSRCDPLWYKDAVIYQLHVKTFCDSNGDGVGDFRGLISKLDYLQPLGVTCVWLLPVRRPRVSGGGQQLARRRDALLRRRRRMPHGVLSVSAQSVRVTLPAMAAAAPLLDIVSGVPLPPASSDSWVLTLNGRAYFWLAPIKTNGNA